ncbi:MAG: aromatic ring-hydroxylating dioxygenase subunit alpha, partial [Thermoplasmata archaeon]|nr:aromatic ring-hydroxylating dioxygenase subunit alpha [Thermoplasmata archaeon]
PKGVVRDPEKNNPVRWPDNRRAAIERGRPREEIVAQRDRQNPGIRSRDDYFQFYAGQPEDVRKAFEEAMGY